MDHTDTEKQSQEELINLPMVIEQLEEEENEINELTAVSVAHQEANKTILAFTAAAGAIAAIPIPLADAPLLIAQQTAMLAKISDIYKINLRKNGLRSLVFTVLGISGTTVLGKTITSGLVKLIPFAGPTASAVIFGGTAASLTAALGKAYATVCESVAAGELEEHELLEHKGRQLLQTAFRNEIRLAMKKHPHEDWDKEDVLHQNGIPADESPISMNCKDQENAPEKDEDDQFVPSTPKTESLDSHAEKEDV